MLDLKTFFRNENEINGKMLLFRNAMLRRGHSGIIRRHSRMPSLRLGRLSQDRSVRRQVVLSAQK